MGILGGLSAAAAIAGLAIGGFIWANSDHEDGRWIDDSCESYAEAIDAANAHDAVRYREAIRSVDDYKEAAFEEATANRAEWREWLAAVGTLDTQIEPHPTSLPDQIGSDEMTAFCDSR